MAPDDFIPLAVETGLIGELGAWILREACAQTKAWQDAGFPDLEISVNAAAAQITHDRLHVNIVDMLWEVGLDPKCLDIELTESVLMQEGCEVLEALQVIAEMGRSGSPP